MKPKPYVGVTGVVTKEEVESVINEFENAHYTMDSPHIPMLGFLVSFKTLNKKLTKNKRYPNIESLPELIEHADNRVLTMVHYNSREYSTIADQVSKVFENLYPSLCSAIQLNIVWPNTKQVNLIKKRFPKMKIVFQANRGVLNLPYDDMIDKMIDYLHETDIDYVLIDPSGGKGEPIKIEQQLDFFDWLRVYGKETNGLTPGFAGGLTGSNVEDALKQVIAETKTSDFCIDAEGGLRDKITNAYGDDTLNIQKVKEYLQAASQVLK